MASPLVSKAEKSYIQAGLTSGPPLRLDGRGLHDFRAVALETGVTPLANGSARVSIGKSPHDGGGGTEVLAATKLEVEDVNEGGVNGGRIVCTVFCSPVAYPHLSSNSLDDLQHDMSTILHQTLSHSSLHPSNLGIIPHKKSWLLNLDLVVLSDAGNIHDALFMSARAALWDTKVPRTRRVEYRTRKGGNSGVKVGGSADMDIDQEAPSGFDTRKIVNATDFELSDYWDEGEILDGRDKWPIGITLNLAPPIHYLDAISQEEASTTLQVLLAFSFPRSSTPTLQAMRMLGPGELDLAGLKNLVKDGEKYAFDIFTALNAKLKDEDLRRNQKARSKFAQR